MHKKTSGDGEEEGKRGRAQRGKETISPRDRQTSGLAGAITHPFTIIHGWGLWGVTLIAAPRNIKWLIHVSINLAESFTLLGRAVGMMAMVRGEPMVG